MLRHRWSVDRTGNSAANNDFAFVFDHLHLDTSRQPNDHKKRRTRDDRSAADIFMSFYDIAALHDAERPAFTMQ